VKELFKKIIPAWLLKWYRNRPRSAAKIFTETYNRNLWGSAESISGTGSEFNQTKTLIKDLEKLLAELNIKTVLDIPCGDFNWMQKVDLSKIEYTGADIVKKLIRKNGIENKDKSNLKFVVLNLIKDPLPMCDMIITRDCLVHLSYADIFTALKNIQSSGCKYLLTTTFTDHRINSDIITGGWRTINLQEEPFNLPPPILVINENCTEWDGAYKDKSMALWEISKI